MKEKHKKSKKSKKSKSKKSKKRKRDSTSTESSSSSENSDDGEYNSKRNSKQRKQSGEYSSGVLHSPDISKVKEEKYDRSYDKYDYKHNNRGSDNRATSIKKEYLSDEDDGRHRHRDNRDSHSRRNVYEQSNSSRWKSYNYSRHSDR